MDENWTARNGQRRYGGGTRAGADAGGVATPGLARPSLHDQRFGGDEAYLDVTPPPDPPPGVAQPMLWRVAARLYRDHEDTLCRVGGVLFCDLCGLPWPCPGRRLGVRGLRAAWLPRARAGRRLELVRSPAIDPPATGDTHAEVG